MACALGLLLAALAGPLAAAGVTLTDDRGRTVSLPAAPVRIVSLAPHATEWLAAFGAGPRLVGLDPHSDHPPALRALPRLSAYPAPDVEAIAALRPDLVVLWGAGLRRSALDRLAALGIATFVSEPHGLSGLAESAQRLAPIAGEPERAAQVLAGFRAALAELEARHRAAAPIPVFIQVAQQPLFTVTDRDPLAQALALCGVRNVFAGAPGVSVAVGPEAVLARSPRAVIRVHAAHDAEPWSRLGVLAPGGPMRLVAADPAIARPGPRLPALLGTVCAEIDAGRRAPGNGRPPG
ncbi:MAG: ABC transporter substrate-binding protein [Betaproteobacteria bacterium]|nr:ABC transporter substrate-binding protein [Betaproteobacteria bacterium]